MSVSDEELNAYIDGELSPADAARIARMIADDIALADKAAALSALRAQLREDIEIPEFELPELTQPRTNYFRSRYLPGAAAAAVLLIAGLLTFADWDRDGRVAFVESLYEAHESELSTSGGAFEMAAARFGFVPDLRASKLHVAGADQVMVGSAHLDRVLYAGTRGCRVSLFRFDAGDDVQEALQSAHDGVRLAYLWRIGTEGYALFATGMDGNRFQLIAETVRDITLKQLQPDARTRTALARSRKTSPPCA